MNKPLLSIVIANYNYGRFLETGIKSIINQDGFDKCELIIVDGGSTDNSVEVIKKYEDKIAWWVSEKDNGQSDAFNKGFARARGQFGCWVNADDLLLPGTLREVIQCIEKNPQCEWITGGTIFFDGDYLMWRARIGTSITRAMHKWVDATVIGGPSSFFSIQRLKDVGGLNIDLHYTMDGDLWHKFFNIGMIMVHLNRYFWGFRSHNASKTSAAFSGKPSERMKEECIRVSGCESSSVKLRFKVFLLRLHKVFTGCLLRSYLDTKKYNGKNVIKEFWR
jgi:glycosyltransferase involved in cell wall biosynthesis